MTDDRSRPQRRPQRARPRPQPQGTPPEHHEPPIEEPPPPMPAASGASWHAPPQTSAPQQQQQQQKQQPPHQQPQQQQQQQQPQRQVQQPESAWDYRMLIGHSLGDYRIKRLLGAGGMGAVLLGWHAHMEMPFAVKVLRPEHAHNEAFLQRFFHEAHLGAQLRHDNAVSVHNAGIADLSGQFGFGLRLPYLALEYVRGRSVRAAQKLTQGRMPASVAAEIVVQALRALTAAHAIDLIHRDIKPDNLMIADSGIVKITDFGLARSLAGDAALTASGQILGTPTYMSMEQWQGVEDIDGRTDIYSLGATFYCLLTGEPPYPGDQPVAVLHRMMAGEPTPIAQAVPQVDSRLVPIVMRMMAREREERFATAAEALAALEAWQSAHGTDADKVAATLAKLGTPSPEAAAETSGEEPVTDQRPNSAASSSQARPSGEQTPSSPSAGEVQQVPVGSDVVARAAQQAYPPPPPKGYTAPGYPPQQPHYPPQQPAYPPQQPAYPPQPQPAYPPHQQPAYPPQQAAHPAHQQPAHPPRQSRSVAPRTRPVSGSRAPRTASSRRTAAPNSQMRSGATAVSAARSRSHATTAQRQREVPPKKSNTPLVIAITVPGAALLIALLIALTPSATTTDDTPRQAQDEPPPEAPTPTIDDDDEPEPPTAEELANEELQRQLDELLQQVYERELGLEQQREERIATLEPELAEAQAELAELRERVDEAENAVAEAQAAYEEFRAGLDETQREAVPEDSFEAVLERAVRTWEAKVEATARLDSSSAELAATQSAYEEVVGALEELREERNRIWALEVDDEAEAARRDAQLNSLGEQIKAKEEEAAGLRSTIRQLEQTLSEAAEDEVTRWNDFVGVTEELRDLREQGHEEAADDEVGHFLEEMQARAEAEAQWRQAFDATREAQQELRGLRAEYQQATESWERIAAQRSVALERYRTERQRWHEMREAHRRAVQRGRRVSPQPVDRQRLVMNQRKEEYDALDAQYRDAHRRRTGLATTIRNAERTLQDRHGAQEQARAEVQEASEALANSLAPLQRRVAQWYEERDDEASAIAAQRDTLLRTLDKARSVLRDTTRRRDRHHQHVQELNTELATVRRNRNEPRRLEFEPAGQPDENAVIEFAQELQQRAQTINDPSHRQLIHQALHRLAEFNH